MLLRRTWSLLPTVLGLLGLIPAASLPAAEPTSPVAGQPVPTHAADFLQNYCWECHDDQTATAKLSLEALAPHFVDARWVRVYDRLVEGQMPPSDASQPSPEERKQFADWLRGELYAASRAKQQAEGRVMLRRMNRTEYEHTLHDLLGITVPLKELLPEDSPTGGFDTVSSGLETSATHLVRYQEAAERALDAALPGRPVTCERTRQTGLEYVKSRYPIHQQMIEPFIRYEGETMVLCARLYKHMTIQTVAAPVAGRYRVRAAVRAVNTDGRALPVLIGKILPDRFDHEKLLHIIDFQDAPADETKVIEVEVTLPQGEKVYLEAPDLASFHDIKKSLNDAPVGDDFAGPGLAIEWIELEGPLEPDLGYRRLFGDLPQLPRRYVEDWLAGKPVPDTWKQWPPNGHEYAQSPLVAVSKEPKADAERLIRAFLPRAFRRPMSEAAVDYFAHFVHEQLDQGVSFADAMRAGYKAVLCSPHFLFYLEKPGRLDDHAVASRLARFLWSSLPDDELTELAAQGKLTDPGVLRAQTERMLRDPKARRFTESFTGQWLDLRKFHDMKPDAIYVEYDEKLAWSMPLETKRFFAEVLEKNLPTTSFLHSDWTYLNQRLAQHYLIDGVEGMELRRVKLPPDAHRGGVITHASVLKLTTNASYTSPVKRGAWVLDRILGQPPSPPPPDVEAVEPDIRGAVTIREQLELHKSVASCASCHVHIDPPGFALENFDVVGGWREYYRVKDPPKDGQRVELANYPGEQVWLARPVEAGGQTVEGESFENIDEYKQLLLQDPDQLTRSLASKLLIYATGGELEFADREVVEQIVRDVKAKQHGFRSLVHAVVQSRVFLSK